MVTRERKTLQCNLNASEMKRWSSFRPFEPVRYMSIACQTYSISLSSSIPFPFRLFCCFCIGLFRTRFNSFSWIVRQDLRFFALMTSNFFQYFCLLSFCAGAQNYLTEWFRRNSIQKKSNTTMQCSEAVCMSLVQTKAK